MLRTLKDLFDALRPGVQTTPAEDAHTLQLAAAVLLVEVMRSDAEMNEAERRAVLDALHHRFALAEDELDRLMELAQQTARDAHDFHRFTSAINESHEFADKVRMVEYLWQVAYADGTLSAHEHHVIRKIADLLHVPHGAYISAKMRAKEAAGGSESE
jgi:uncharacterized tellurite resistance protein B-like protein